MAWQFSKVRTWQRSELPGTRFALRGARTPEESILDAAHFASEMTCSKRKVAVAILTLLGQVLYITGVPGAWLGNFVAKDRTIPFPCMYRACGCRNAQDCWTKCCCLSPAQRQQWAKRYALTIELGCTVCQVEEPGACCECRECPKEDVQEPSPAKGCNSGCGHCENKKHLGDRSQSKEGWHPIVVHRCRGEEVPSATQQLVLVDIPTLQTVIEQFSPAYYLAFHRVICPRSVREPAEPPPRSFFAIDAC